MLTRVRRWWRQQRLRRARIPAHHWQQCVAQLPVLSHLSRQELLRLRELASLFLHEKTFIGAGGLQVDDAMRVVIAAQACLLVLNLGLDWYDGWHEVIVYPDTFVVEHQERDVAGVVHATRRALGGESWGRGPLILSWADAQPGAHPHGAGSNVVLHEFAHKLDMLTGAANGMPPLHRDMLREAWTQALSQAYANFYQEVERHHHTRIDPYAAESPAEFFAVLSEVFFEAPQRLYQLYPAVYVQLSLFYRQDPLRPPGTATPTREAKPRA
jgi:Mlc titration factor MtfA (ptsG expression regulator)